MWYLSVSVSKPMFCPVNYRVSRRIDTHLKGHYVCSHNAVGGNDVMITSCRYDSYTSAAKNVSQLGKCPIFRCYPFTQFKKTAWERGCRNAYLIIEIINNTRAGIVMFFQSRKGNALLGGERAIGGNAL